MSATQMEFTFRDASILHRELEDRSGLKLEIVLTDNSHTVMSVKRHPAKGMTALRLHHMFLGANSGVIHALAAWLVKPSCRKSGAVIDAFIREHRHLVRKRPAGTRRLAVVGRYFNLKTFYDEVNAGHFGGTVNAAITWGRRPAPGRRRSIRFGSYSLEQNLIRIHPFLDSEHVPEYFVRYIVYHEMLHAHLGIEESETGRRRIHTAEFKRIERTYPDFDRAEAWQAKASNLRKLLR